MTKQTKKIKSPFKEKSLFKKEISDFLSKHKSTIYNNADRISDYFEMSCFNYIVQYYEDIDFIIEVRNIQEGGKYRYKCSTSGNQENFSHFRIYSPRNEYDIFDIHHNLAIESHFQNGIYTTPDISVIKVDSVEKRTDFYKVKRTYSYVKNENMITFAEVKNFHPFPELLFNFIGTVNELKGIYQDYANGFNIAESFAPFLMISGKSNEHTDKIRNSLANRYNINIIFDLFGYGINKNLKLKINQITKLLIKTEGEKAIEEDGEKVLIRDGDLPF